MLKRRGQSGLEDKVWPRPRPLFHGSGLGLGIKLWPRSASLLLLQMYKIEPRQ